MFLAPERFMEPWPTLSGLPSSLPKPRGNGWLALSSSLTGGRDDQLTQGDIAFMGSAESGKGMQIAGTRLILWYRGLCALAHPSNG